MWRYAVGAGSALIVLVAGFFVISAMAGDQNSVPPPSEEARSEKAEVIDMANPMAFVTRTRKGPPPTATDLSKEEKRFNRYDKDKNGAVSRDEYLQSRKKAYAKLDANGDGVLSFDEYAIKTVTKFAKADGNRSGGLNRSEFSTTRVIRKNKPKPNCPPQPRQPADTSSAKDDDEAES